jgi:integrase
MTFKTQAEVDRLRLPAGKTDVFVWDARCPGLSVRCQGGKRSFVVWYSAGGMRRRLSLGPVEGLKLADARHKATEVVQNAKGGHDALAERDAAKAKTADTLGALVKVYLERRAKPKQRPRSYAETERHLRLHWKPLLACPVDGITRRAVAEQIERIRAERGPTAAAHARVYLSACYGWAMKAGLADHNPVVGTEAPAAPPSKARVLAPQELAAIWRAAGDDDFGRIVKLLALLGARRNEIAALAWPEVDRDRALVTIPADRAKNNRALEIPLCDSALALLPEPRPGCAYVFGRERNRAFSGFGAAKARLDKRIEQLNGEPLKSWRLHDLRHSFVTHCAELGVEPHVIEACVNHQSGHKSGIAGLYNKATYREQKKVAFQRYANWLLEVGEGHENVVAFQNVVASG